MKKKYFLISLVLLIVFFVASKEARSIVIDFEGLGDLTSVTDQFSALGVTFSGATAITAGISLNEFEFPPYSGTNVVFDDGGPITLTFSIPAADFGAYFTYFSPLTLSFFDASNNLEGTVTSNSSFTSNLALSGDPGSSPNELLQFAWASGISSVVIAGDPLGGSFTMDDLTYAPIPEPGTLFLLSSGILGFAGYRSFVRHRRNC